MKKLLTILLALSMALALAACGGGSVPADSGTSGGGSDSGSSSDSGSEKYRVAYFNRDDADDFLANVRDGIQSRCEAKGDIEFTSYNGAGDAAKQVTQIEDALSRGVDMVVILPQDKESVISKVQECNEKGIPVLTVTVGLAEESGEFTYVGANDYDLAYTETSYLLEHLEPGKKFIYLRFTPGSFVAAERDRGSLAAIADAGREDDVLTTMEYKNTTADAQKLMEDLIQNYGDDFAGVLTHNDKSIYGVINAINAANLDPSSKVICSIDGEVSACELVKKRPVDHDC